MTSGTGFGCLTCVAMGEVDDGFSSASNEGQGGVLLGRPRPRAVFLGLELPEFSRFLLCCFTVPAKAAEAALVCIAATAILKVWRFVIPTFKIPKMKWWESQDKRSDWCRRAL